jgi:hypothetical protein
MLDVPVEGTWTFFLSSDDGSTLVLDGHQVVDNGECTPCVRQ